MSKEDWKSYQIENAKHIITEDTFDPESIRYIGGLDISFVKDSDRACAYLTVFDVSTNSVVLEEHELCVMDVPYIPGYLGFREIPHYKKILNRISGSEFYPQVLFIDGFGVLHHREFGCASQLGFELDIPTVGVAKTMLDHDGMYESKIVRDFKRMCHTRGDYMKLVGRSGRVWGVALRSSDKASNPIFVSVGHKMSLDTARNLVLKTCIYKNPEPIRISDIRSKLFF